MANLLVAPSEIDDSLSTPLYAQLHAAIRKRIVSGEVEVGDPLPTEKELSESLGLGRSTVRAALTSLVDEGLIVRRAGKGTFVSRPKVQRNLNGIYNFSEEMRQLGLEPTSIVLSFQKVKPSPTVAEQLGVQRRGKTVFEIRRIRSADGVPVTLETTYLPCALFPTLVQADAEGSLYERLAELGDVFPETTHDYYEAVNIAEEDAEALKREPGLAALRITRVATDASKGPFEYTIVIAPGDRVRYEITTQRDKMTYSMTTA